MNLYMTEDLENELIALINREGFDAIHTALINICEREIERCRKRYAPDVAYWKDNRESIDPSPPEAEPLDVDDLWEMLTNLLTDNEIWLRIRENLNLTKKRLH
jgi:hypothetical protein